MPEQGNWSRQGEIEVNAATLKPNKKLAKLRNDLQQNSDLRKQLTENPNAVLDKYGLTVALPSGTLRRLSLGGGITLPVGPAVHADTHVDTHLDFNPHVDQNPHIDLG